MPSARPARPISPASARKDGLQVPDRYDDGGVSGGTLERPALKRLLADVEAGKIDVVVVYKIDRLSRSMLDFPQAGRDFRAPRRHLCFHHPVVQHHRAQWDA